MRRAWIVLALSILLAAPLVASASFPVSKPSVFSGNLLTKEILTGPGQINSNTYSLCHLAIETETEFSSGVTYGRADLSGSLGTHSFYGTNYPALFMHTLSNTGLSCTNGFSPSVSYDLGLYTKKGGVSGAALASDQSAGAGVVAVGVVHMQTGATSRVKPSFTSQPVYPAPAPTTTTRIQEAITCGKEVELEFTDFGNQPSFKPGTAWKMQYALDTEGFFDGTYFTSQYCPGNSAIHLSSFSEPSPLAWSETGFQGWMLTDIGKITSPDLPIAYELPMVCSDVRLVIKFAQTDLSLDHIFTGEYSLNDLGQTGNENDERVLSVGKAHSGNSVVNCDVTKSFDCTGITLSAIWPQETQSDGTLQNVLKSFEIAFSHNSIEDAGGMVYEVWCDHPEPDESQATCEGEFSGTWLPSLGVGEQWSPPPTSSTVNCCLDASVGAERRTSTDDLYVCENQDGAFVWEETRDPGPGGCTDPCCESEYGLTDLGDVGGGIHSYEYCWDGDDGSVDGSAPLQLFEGEVGEITARLVSQQDASGLTLDDKHTASVVVADGDLYFCGPQWYVPPTVSWASYSEICMEVVSGGISYVCTLGQGFSGEQGFVWRQSNIAASSLPQQAVFATAVNKDLLTPTLYNPPITSAHYPPDPIVDPTILLWEKPYERLTENDAFYCEAGEYVFANTEETCAIPEPEDTWNNPIQGKWFEPIGPSNDKKCCFETRQFGAENYNTLSFNGENWECVQDETGFTWQQFDGVRLEICDLNVPNAQGELITGFRVEGDPDTYCCYEGTAADPNPFHGAPHLVVEEDKSFFTDADESQQNPRYCLGSLDPVLAPVNGHRYPEQGKQVDWAFNPDAQTDQGVARWDHCSGVDEITGPDVRRGDVHGKFICAAEVTGVQYELSWRECKCDPDDPRKNYDANNLDPVVDHAICNTPIHVDGVTRWCTNTTDVSGNALFWTDDPDLKLFCDDHQHAGFTCCKTNEFFIEKEVPQANYQGPDRYDSCYDGFISRERDNPNDEAPLLSPHSSTVDVTNSIVLNQKLHFCSDHWTTYTQATFLETHPLCDELSEDAKTYSCRITTDGYRWESGQGNTFLLYDQELASQLSAQHATMLGSGAIGCIDGQLRDATDQELCQLAGGDWPDASTGATGCCLPHTEGTRITGVTELICEAQQWRDAVPVSCTVNGENGQRFASDPAGYCCTTRSATADKPHLIEDGVNPYGTDQRKWICDTDGELKERLSGKHPVGDLPAWSYDDATLTWNFCTQSEVGSIQGTFLCVAYEEFFVPRWGWEECGCTASNPDSCKASEHLDGFFCGRDTQGMPHWHTDFRNPLACLDERHVGSPPVCCFRGVYEAHTTREDGEILDYTEVCFGYNDDPLDIVLEERGFGSGLHTVELVHNVEIQGELLPQTVRTDVYATELGQGPRMYVCGDHWLYDLLPTAGSEDPFSVMEQQELCQAGFDKNANEFHCWVGTEAWTMERGAATNKAIRASDANWDAAYIGLRDQIFQDGVSYQDVKGIGCFNGDFTTERDETFCRSPEGLQGNWLDATGNFPFRCCFSGAEGRSYLGSNAVYTCSSSGNWDVEQVVSCGASGVVFLDDESSGYCCEQGMYEPYGFVSGAFTLPGSQTEHFCDDGQIRIDENNLWPGITKDWAFADGFWDSCEAPALYDRHGNFLCAEENGNSGFLQCTCPDTGSFGYQKNCGEHVFSSNTWYCSQSTAGSPFWTQDPTEGLSCSPDQIIGEVNPVCCHPNTYAAGTYTHTNFEGTQILTEACFDGQILREENSPVQTSVELATSVDRQVVVTEHTGKQVHVCGTTWNIDNQQLVIVQEHGLCGEVQAKLQTESHVCWVDSTGEWDWVSRGQVDAVVDNTHPQWQSLQAKLGQDWQAFGCADGSPEEAVEKYSPPPNLETGFCPQSQCYSPSSLTGCVSPGFIDSGYVCTDTVSGVQWVSALRDLAQELLAYAEGDFVINCGDEAISSNKESGTTDVYGHCQLANDLNGQGEPDYIILGLAFKPESLSAQNTFFSELGAIQTITPRLPVDETNPYADEDFYLYDHFSGIAYFSETDTFSGSGTIVSQLLDWIEGLVSGRPEVPELIGVTSDQFYITGTVSGSSFTNMEVYAVEYATQFQTGCPTQRTIVTPSGTSCYDETTWRRIIRVRP